MQPWATLLVHGIMKLNPQPKPTSWTQEKGTYLIRAAQKWSKEQYRLCLEEPFYNELEKLGFNFSICNSLTNLPFGQIIGSVEVSSCNIINVIISKSKCESVKYPWIYLKDHKGYPIAKYIYEPELSFGNYRDGHYAWICENPRILKSPIPYKGGQGYYPNFKGDKSKLIFL